MVSLQTEIALLAVMTFQDIRQLRSASGYRDEFLWEWQPVTFI
jgi:hypothetical protein